MAIYVFIPPVRKPTGGVAVLIQVAAHLAGAGHEVRLVPREDFGWRPQDMEGMELTHWSEMALTPADVWLVPEGWVNALAPGLVAQARCVLYVQNWAYLFSALPEDVTWHQLPVRFVAVSDPVAYYVRRTMGVEPPVIRPGIDRDVFRNPGGKPGDRVNVAYMPRKNKAQAAQIRSAFESMRATDGGEPVNWIEVQGLDARGVAQVLGRSHIFLATGFPEGLALPPLEAMACGCLPVGFSGFGGWDYMRQAGPGANFAPWWPLRQVPWAGNGLWSADADVLDAALNLRTAVRWWEENDPLLQEALENCGRTVAGYTMENQRRETLAYFENLISS